MFGNYQPLYGNTRYILPAPSGIIKTLFLYIVMHPHIIATQRSVYSFWVAIILSFITAFIWSVTYHSLKIFIPNYTSQTIPPYLLCPHYYGLVMEFYQNSYSTLVCFPILISLLDGLASTDDEPINSKI